MDMTDDKERSGHGGNGGDGTEEHGRGTPKQGGRGTAHKGGRSCCGRHQPMRRFMDACLLLLLYDRTDHGYRLAEQLADFGFADANVSTLYRVMRRMEDAGWVCSQWEQGGKGPQRRVYTITDGGKEALSSEIAVFEQRKTSIETLLTRYRQMTT